MRGVFRREPDDITENYTASHQGRGVDYIEGFEVPPLRALMWQLEQSLLAELLPGTGAQTVLDFACGTGRISGVLSRELPRADIVGLDVAESMLEVARESVPGVSFVGTDGRALRTVVPDATMDLVTAFRFFPNADAELRASVTDAIARVVRPGGYVLFNNHRNFWSPSYLARRLRQASPAPGARNSDLVGPFLERGFSVVARHSLGVLPQSDERLYVLPDRWAPRLERFNGQRLSRWHALGTNTIWLLRKDAPPDPDVRPAGR